MEAGSVGETGFPCFYISPGQTSPACGNHADNLRQGLSLPARQKHRGPRSCHRDSGLLWQQRRGCCQVHLMKMNINLIVVGFQDID